MKSTRIRAKTIRTRTRKKCTRTCDYDTRIRIIEKAAKGSTDVRWAKALPL